MSHKLIVVTGLLAALVAITFDTNVAEARCCRARRSCGGYNQGYGCNTGCNTGYQNNCSTGACQVAPGQLMAQPGQSAAPAAAPQAEVVAPPPPEAAPAPAPAPAPESAKVKPEGE
ncbi:MAG: hypothetical protein JWN70_718 [Planctomycetaceae bacterium]|nr:hypothetical protein [Planctomycetaceae bacterium]